MLLDFDIKKSENAINKQRMVTNIITSQEFINTIANEVENEKGNNEPIYIYHSPAEKFETWHADKTKEGKKLLKKNTPR